MKRLVPYFRVSTTKQGESGLGLEAQQAAVRAYARSCGATIVTSFREVESGRKSARPQLAAAIEACRKNKATLVVAKLDRLARSVSFTSSLMDSGVEFVCCDVPSANRLTIHILSAVAQNEAEAIGQRTKAALAALKARGVKLGNSTAALRRKACEANVKSAQMWNSEIRVLAAKRRAAGRTLQEVADYLTGRGVLTRRGNKWTPTAVMRLLAS